MAGPRPEDAGPEAPDPGHGVLDVHAALALEPLALELVEHRSGHLLEVLGVEERPVLQAHEMPARPEDRVLPRLEMDVGRPAGSWPPAGRRPAPSPLPDLTSVGPEARRGAGRATRAPNGLILVAGPRGSQGLPGLPESRAKMRPPDMRWIVHGRLCSSATARRPGRSRGARRPARRGFGWMSWLLVGGRRRRRRVWRHGHSSRRTARRAARAARRDDGPEPPAR